MSCKYSLLDSFDQHIDHSRTNREANRRRILVDEIKQVKEDIEAQMNQGHSTSR